MLAAAAAAAEPQAPAAPAAAPCCDLLASCTGALVPRDERLLSRRLACWSLAKMCNCTSNRVRLRRAAGWVRGA
jgi:hypothetical protein